MYRIMLQKLWHKKWMNLCLLLGSILLIATVVSFPLYQNAAYDRMLQEEFRNYLTTNGVWPTIIRFSTISKKDQQGVIISRMEDELRRIPSTVGMTKKDEMVYYALVQSPVQGEWERSETENLSVRLGSLSGLADHAKILGGEMYSESGLTEDGAIEVVVSQTALVKMKLLVGETLTFQNMTDAKGGEIKLYVKGVFDVANHSDSYWQINPNEMTNVCLMNPELFHEMFTGTNAATFSISCDYYSIFEFQDLKANQVSGLMEAVKYLTEQSDIRNTLYHPAYQDVLEQYQKKQQRIDATLTILQIPVLVMLGAFLFMISGQMYDMERNEISVIKSRGSSGEQIFRLYLYQSMFLALMGGLLGIPLGTVFSRILGSARSFLEFSNNAPLEITFSTRVWVYAGAAMAVTLLIMTIPAIKHSRVSIVKLKQQKALKKKSWWEKIFLDFILLGISLYGYFSFRKNAEQMAQSVLRGEALDPLLYISSSLFIMGLGLVFLRLQPYLVQLIYLIGKRFWKPASYASFMENLKNGRKQQFIMLFLIMTISLGMYHATVARTILQNAYENAEYINGADVIEQEVWVAIKDQNGNYTGEYIEPDYSKYAAMDCAQSYTRVYRFEDAYAKLTDGTQKVTVMGIHTKDFGEVTWVDRNLNGKHYYEILNELAVNVDGVLVSENFRSKLGYKVGDYINYQREEKAPEGSVKAKIVGFFSYFPGYAPTVAEVNPDGTVSVNEQWLIVAHFNKLRQVGLSKPYEVWISLKDGHEADEAYSWFEERGVRLKKYVDKSKELKNTLEDPLLQGTNGVLTMGFIVTILLCAVGYLIYWIMSIRSREMIFGVLRACGLHKAELFQMLMNEQIFSGVFSIAAGIFIGKLTSKMFVPMLQQAYAATNQVLPMKLVVQSSDMMRLYVVIISVVVLCLAILIFLLLKMNVTKALKLGEE